MVLDRLPRCDGKAWGQGIESRIGQDLGRIEVQFLAPDQPSLLPRFDDRIKIPALPITLADTG